MGQLIAELEYRRPDLPYFDPDSTGPYPEEPPLSLDDLIELYPEAVRRCSTEPVAMTAAQRATTDLQTGRPGYLALWRHFVAVSRDSQESDFDRLGVRFDLWMGESDVEGRIPEMLERVKASGAAEESEGALIVRVDRPDDRMEIPPLLLVTSRGSYLYSTTDLATIDQRVQELGAGAILYVVDARQSLHFEQVFRAARLTGIAPDAVDLEHIPFGTMNGPDGRPFKTREGGVVRLSDLIEMVTTAALGRIDEADIAPDTPRRSAARSPPPSGLLRSSSATWPTTAAPITSSTLTASPRSRETAHMCSMERSGSSRSCGARRDSERQRASLAAVPPRRASVDGLRGALPGGGGRAIEGGRRTTSPSTPTTSPPISTASTTPATSSARRRGSPGLVARPGQHDSGHPGTLARPARDRGTGSDVSRAVLSRRGSRR